MATYLIPALAMSLGLLVMTNPLGLGDAVFRQLNTYARDGWTREAARRQAFVMGRTTFAVGAGALTWLLLLEFDASRGVKTAFLAMAIPPTLALVVFTIIDTNRRATQQRRPGRAGHPGAGG